MTKFKPSKRLPAFDKSASLKFSQARREAELDKVMRNEDDPDQVLRNIRDMLEAKGKRLKSFDPQNI